MATKTIISGGKKTTRKMSDKPVKPMSDPNPPASEDLPTEPKRQGHTNPGADKVPMPGGHPKPDADTLEEGQNDMGTDDPYPTKPRKLSDK